MIVGFNHNVSYRGSGFHVQTEDSGVKKPQLMTLLYHGGTIIASQKTVYADILKVDNLNQVVEDLAKEQHKGMLRRLTKGEFDQRIVEFGIPLGPASVPAGTVGGVPGETHTPPVDTPAIAVELPEALPVATSAVAEPVQIVEEPIVDKFRKSPPVQNLDALIYAYLTGADRL
jgi:hypothetical protein